MGGKKDQSVSESQATQQLAEVLARIAKLPGANLEPPQFFANFLQLSVAATGSKGGAIWIMQPEQGPQCYCHVNLELCQPDQADQQKLVIEAIKRTIEESKSLVIPAAGIEGAEATEESSSNKCPHPLFFKPLRAANQVAMVLQMIGPETLSPHEFRMVVGLLDQIGESAETYLAHRRAAVLEDDRKSLSRLLQYAENVHGSLEPEKVVYQIANLGRDAIGCDRVVIWIDPKVKRGLRAVSGIDKPDRRAVLMQAMEKLSKHCLEIKKPIVASRQQLVELAEEEKLTQLLKNYFNVSKLDQIFLQPIKKDERYLGVISAEGFDESTSTNLAGIIAAVASHGAVALGNALEMASMPMMRPLAKLKTVSQDPKKRRKWLIIATIIIAALGILLLLPWTIKIESACELTPRHIRLIESPLDGVQIKRIIRARGNVDAGEIIAQLDDLDLQTKRTELRHALEQENITKRASLSETERKKSELQIAKLQNNIDFLETQIAKCQVKAPITGTILTAQLERKEGLTVNKGDLICEVADLTKWQLLLDVPQEEIDWVQQGLVSGGDTRDQPARQLEVRFFLAAYPQYKLSTNITSIDQISQMARTKEQGNVFEIRLDVSGSQLKTIEQGLRDGMVGQAKISTVSRSLGYVLLRKVIRFFRVTFF